MLKRYRQTSAILLSCLFLAPIATSLDAQTEDPYELNIVLRNALAQKGAQTKFSPNLVIDLSRRDGLWWPIAGHALNYNQSQHDGVVVSADIADNSVKLDIYMRIGSDQWVKSGYAHYTISLSGKDADGKMTGSYEGTFHDLPFKGEAYGFVKPPRKVVVPNFKPLEQNEFPRIVLRKSDLPKFREKLKTRFGQDAIEHFKAQTSDFLSLAFMYAATGEKQYAQQAIPLLEKEMNNFDGGSVAEKWRFRCNSIAMACDLIWDTLTPAFKANLNEYCEKIGEAACNNLGLFAAGFNFNPCSNWFGPVVGTGGTLCMLLYGQPGPEPMKPLGALGAQSTTSTNDAIGRMVSKYSDTNLAASVANDLAFKQVKWQIEHAIWKKTGLDMKKALLFDAVTYQNYKHLRFGIGDGGFQSEVGSYPLFAHNTALLFAAQYRQMTGRDISPYPDATHFLARRMISEWYGEDGNVFTMSINGNSALKPYFISSQFPLVPEEWKPAMLWAWNFLTKVKHGDESTYINVVKQGGVVAEQLMAFVNYPLDMKPVHPKDANLPLTWKAPTRGMYQFRSGWEGKDEFICQAFVKATPIAGNSQANAGSFKIWGLQREWITGHDGKKDVRQNLPLVDFPDYEVLSTNANSEYQSMNLFGCGILKDLTMEKDGSGTISIDLNEVYGRPKLVKVESSDSETEAPKPSSKILTARQLRNQIKKEEAPPRREQFIDANFVRQNSEFDPVCIKGMRAFAFDYSGKAGVPCLAVAVDHIEGGKGKTWRMPPPPPALYKEAPDPTIVFTNNGFTVTHPDKASMRVVFVAPTNLKASIQETQIDREKSKEKQLLVTATAITVTGPTGEEGDFFAIMTFSRGEHPKITCEGTGLNAKVTVGDRKLRFDGTRVVME